MAEVVVLYTGPVVTINEARKSGEKRYFTGVPCLHGHIQQRVVSSNQCLTCGLNLKKSKYNPVKASAAKKRQKEAREKKYFQPILHSVLYNGPLVTRHEAIDRGLKKYFTGEPCKSGHIAERYASKNSAYRGPCVVCHSLSRTEGREARLLKITGRPRPSKCDICECNGSSHRSGIIVYDHCHKSGKFRGWLCNDCNAALGFSKDSPELLRKMAKYLENTSGEIDNKEEKQSTVIQFRRS